MLQPNFKFVVNRGVSREGAAKSGILDIDAKLVGVPASPTWITCKALNNLTFYRSR